jgi:hypothetical protein
LLQLASRRIALNRLYIKYYLDNGMGDFKKNLFSSSGFTNGFRFALGMPIPSATFGMLK